MALRGLTESQRDWLRLREYSQRHRYELGQAAAQEYPDLPKIEGTALLTRPEWLPTEPIPLHAVDLEFVPDRPFAGRTGADPLTAAVRPQRPDGSRYPTYSAAMADLAAPAVFENRSTYRLLDADLSGPRGRLVFGRGRYFDAADVGEAAAHEYALARLTGSQTPWRTALGNPCALTRCPATLAIAALTVRHDRTTGEATFLLHWRDPAKVGHTGGLFMVVPVGVFQASDDQPCNERHDALRSGLVSAHVLGMGVDPLTFATDLLTLVVFDAQLFDELFVGMVDTNTEGRLVSSTPSAASHEGFPCTPDQVRRMARHPSMQAAGAAALTLALRRLPV